MFSIHQDFVSPWADERGQAIRQTQYGIELAAKLGIPQSTLDSKIKSLKINKQQFRN